MKKLFTLLTLFILTTRIYAVSVTFNVDMTGQDVSKGVFIVGTLNAWTFTAMTDPNTDNIYSVTLDLASGTDQVFYYIRNNSWTDYLTYRETIPAECANESMKYRAGGWAGDRYIDVIGTNPIVLDHKFSTCIGVTSIKNLDSDTKFVVSPNPTKGEIKVLLNQAGNAGSISIRNISGKVILSKTFLKGDESAQFNLTAIAKGIYIIEVKNSKKRTIQKIIVE